MTWFGWTYLAIVLLATVGRAARVDKPRKPYPLDEFVIDTIITGLIFWGLAVVGVTH